ncbi:LPO_1073/Vpar_1526 family protein [Pantoea agglomerans]|uniref:LPO_1073/Vpar_1526 family protein n=1 Tax=Enterobacter agglomerans TaxID=549 RepID=UPI000DAC5C98|nr:LPO_1073/Vpar_1526 family protein [Pantoea agglomerans]RAH34022.1 hypothetical protein DOT37_07280 [Pantoea agglomerans]TGX94247.1 hypothetical protein E5821_07265 [Pantoea agglomerans]
MSLIDKSGQHVGDGSTAIQISGDAIIGNTTSEVILLCELVVSKQMSALRDEAMGVAMSRARQFGEEVAESIASNIDERIIDKLRDPDVQFSINQAVTQVARKGIGTKSDLLKELIVSKLKNEEEDQDLIIDHAIDITQRLTTSEIKFLALIIYFRLVDKFYSDENLKEIIISGQDSLKYPKLTVEHCKKIFTEIYTNYDHDFARILGELNSLKEIDPNMMQIKGCFISGKHFKQPFYDFLKSFTLVNNDAQSSFDKDFPLISEILLKFGFDSHETFGRLAPSPVGISIAENYLRCHGFLV